MKISIERFGPIKSFEYDLDKDLVAVYGENNIGKSFSMQIVYLLIKAFIESFNNRRYQMFDNEIVYFATEEIDASFISGIVSNFMSSDQDVIDITNSICDMYSIRLTSMIMDQFLNSCENTFGNFQNTLTAMPIIKIIDDSITLIINLQDKSIIDQSQQFSIYLKKSKSNFHKSRKSTSRYDVYVYDKVDVPTKIIRSIVAQKVNQTIVKMNRFVSGVYFLPASRSGIYKGMSSFGPMIAELSKYKALLARNKRNELYLPSISEPISDYFVALSSISNVKEDEDNTLSSYVSKIEESILKGKITYDINKSLLQYKPNDLTVKFDMSEVSSMVSEISPIVAFLKYVVVKRSRYMRRNNGKIIIFIEEPEAHLHPKNQIALIEIFAELCKTNVKIIISSHSNYIFNKMNNLILAKKIDFKLYEPILLETSTSGSISRYLDIDEFGTSDENFIDVSIDLANEREKLINDLYERDL